ncbi:P-loop NTPase family protein [Anaerobium acetethylicum]|uniref:Cellulose biosynthesis protein BcsQ n=1 Tax=Anaerobium acetethylicum TaxID=1619234 RepID=A0A1D3TRR8_9FIRM|nr:hypothetical protein [Anaerobium acetethylicum]SCP96370.1 hypothetical protein SAMN05421730_1004138 [Anaerobium acetethylicum]
MKKRIFAVCDLEAHYAFSLMEYLNANNRIPFQIQAFSSAESLCAYRDRNLIEVLLISGQAINDEVRNLGIQNTYILSEGEGMPEFLDYPSVYKYQSSEHIIREVMGYYAESAGPKREADSPENRALTVGIYSPIRRTLKTSFAITLGQILAKDRATLYVNLEEYSGLSALLGKEFRNDLSDLMYFVKQGNKNIVQKVNEMVQTLNNLDYLPPALSPEDLRGVTREEWGVLFKEIGMKSAYERVVVDFGDTAEGLFELLSGCQQIYMPVREDAVSLAKLQQYEELVRQSGYGEILDRTKKIKLPYHNSFGLKEYYLEQLAWGELGDYVRELVRNDGLQ